MNIGNTNKHSKITLGNSVKDSVHTSVNHHVYLPIYNKVWGQITYHIDTTVRNTIIRTL
jgi:hypothetical protein